MQVAVGEQIELALDTSDLHLFSAQTGECILDRSAGQPAGSAGQPAASALPPPAPVNELELS
jgi:hypothetical protein